MDLDHGVCGDWNGVDSDHLAVGQVMHRTTQTQRLLPCFGEPVCDTSTCQQQPDMM
jgi:hypothetical protein